MWSVKVLPNPGLASTASRWSTGSGSWRWETGNDSAAEDMGPP